jgi:hypothetical protein
MDTKEVDIQEFVSVFLKYTAGNSPVAVIEDGKAIGYFIPVAKYSDADVAALKDAGAALDQLLGTGDIDMDEVVAEVDELRKESSRQKKTGTKAA